MFLSGPLSQCHDFADPSPYYKSCVYDVCATSPDRDVVIVSIWVYGRACSDGGNRPESGSKPGPYRKCCDGREINICRCWRQEGICEWEGSRNEGARILGVSDDKLKLVVSSCNFVPIVAIQCPGELVYQVCGSACPATCLEPAGDENCPESCTERCGCPEGLVLEGDRCIQASECGCTLEDGFYLPVSRWS